MNTKELIDTIITELSYRTDSGIPDLKNPDHISILSEIMTELNFGEVKYEILGHLVGPHTAAAIIEAQDDDPTDNVEPSDRYERDELNTVITYQTDPDNPEDSKEKSAVVGDLLKGKKGPGYEAAMKFLGSKGIEVDDTGGVEDADDLESRDGAEDDEDAQAAAAADREEEKQRQRTQAMFQQDPSFQSRLDSEEEYSTQQARKRYEQLDPPSEVSRIFDGTQTSVENAEPYLTAKDEQLIEDFKIDFKMLADNPEDEELAEKMVEKYGLEKSSGKQVKVYMRNITFEARKYLGQTKETEFIKDTLENALGRELDSSSAGNKAKRELSRTTKPDLETKRTAKEDPNVQAIFDEYPFEVVDDGMKQLFGPIGEDGNLLRPSSQHSKEYLKQSIEENQSIQDTIEQLKDLEREENVSPELRKALEEHQSNMKSILETENIPSPGAAEKVGSSYAVMAEKLNTESPSLASSMMKNIAEMAMYDYEIAKGDEAYLPSHGSFPSGDKIKIERDEQGEGKIERASYVSVKFGKKGEFGSYGFPGETAQYINLHKDEDYKDRLGSVPGIDGYELGVRNDLIEDREKSLKMLQESQLGEAISDVDAFFDTIRSNLEAMKELKQEVGYDESSGSGKKQLVVHKEKIRAMEKKIAKTMNKYIDDEMLEQLVGEDNARTMMKRPGAMIAGITFASALRTSQGFPSLEHNHQEFKDGKYVSEIDTHEDGTPNMKLWKLTWRAYDDRSGGLLASFNSKRAKM